MGSREGTEAIVAKMPKCQFPAGEFKPCEDSSHDALYDGKTKLGPWAYMCQAAFDKLGEGLGTGRGQKLVLAK